LDYKNEVYPFLSNEEIIEKAYKIMLLAQDMLYEKVNEVHDAKTKLTKENFFMLLQNSKNLQGVMSEAVDIAIKLIDWDRCFDIATAHLVEKQQAEEVQKNNINLT